MKIAPNQAMTVAMNSAKRVVSVQGVSNVFKDVVYQKKIANVLRMRNTSVEQTVTKIVEPIPISASRKSAAIVVTVLEITKESTVYVNHRPNVNAHLMRNMFMATNAVNNVERRQKSAQVKRSTTVASVRRILRELEEYVFQIPNVNAVKMNRICTEVGARNNAVMESWTVLKQNASRDVSATKGMSG